MATKTDLTQPQDYALSGSQALTSREATRFREISLLARSRC